GSAVLVSLIVCLYAAPQIVWVLKRPLKDAALIQAGRTQQKAIVRIGSNVVATIEPPTNRIGPLDLGTNRVTLVQAEPVVIGTNILLSLSVDPNPPREAIMEAATDLI